MGIMFATSIGVRRPILVMGGDISWARNPGLNKAEVNMYVFVSLCFLIADAMLRAASSPAAAVPLPP